MTHEELHELASLYALGALDGAERIEFEAHLATCVDCGIEVRALMPVVHGLARSVPQREPPPDLRQRILRSASDTSAPPPIALTAPRRPAWGWAVVPWLATAASLVAAVALGWHSVQLRDQIDDLERRVREATLRAEERERQVADAQRAAFEAQSTVAILSAPDLARIDLAGQPVAPDARARAFWSRSRGLVFTASNLPPLPTGKTYQLWVVTAHAPVSATLVQPDPSGRATTVVETPRDIPQPVAMAVTLEPAGGVPAPTGETYLVGLADSH